MTNPPDPQEGTRWRWDLRLLATAYAVGVAFLHQFIYWNTFSVNILEHSTVLDLAKFTVWPLMGALTATPLVFQFIHIIDEAVATKNKVTALIAMLSFVLPIGISIYHKEPLLYLIGAGAVACALYAFLIYQKVDPFKQYIDNPAARRFMLMTLIYLPLISAASAMWRAELVHQGKKVERAYLPADVLNIHDLSPDQILTYLGSTEDYAFFWIDSGPGVLRIRTDTMSGFRIKPIEGSKP